MFGLFLCVGQKVLMEESEYVLVEMLEVGWAFMLLHFQKSLN
jgi:hypothetical protein